MKTKSNFILATSLVILATLPACKQEPLPPPSYGTMGSVNGSIQGQAYLSYSALATNSSDGEFNYEEYDISLKSGVTGFCGGISSVLSNNNGVDTVVAQVQYLYNSYSTNYYPNEVNSAPIPTFGAPTLNSSNAVPCDANITNQILYEVIGSGSSAQNNPVGYIDNGCYVHVDTRLTNTGPNTKNYVLSAVYNTNNGQFQNPGTSTNAGRIPNLTAAMQLQCITTSTSASRLKGIR